MAFRGVATTQILYMFFSDVDMIQTDPDTTLTKWCSWMAMSSALRPQESSWKGEACMFTRSSAFFEFP